MGARRFALLGVLLLVDACGGGGSGGAEAGGGLSARALWEQPALTALDAPTAQQQGGGDRFGPELPGAARTVRFFFSSSSGEACCVAVDPRSIPVDPSLQQRVLVLKELPVGAGNLQITAYPTDFAPAPGVAATTCATKPSDVARACVEGREQTASFSSDPQPVNVNVGVDSDAGDILIRALPFIVPGTLNPASGEDAFNPVAAGFTVADAVTGVNGSSVGMQITSGGIVADGEPLDLEPCDDAGSSPCSDGGALEVSGFVVSRPAQEIATGDAEARIEARNLAAPPQSLRLTYGFSVQGPVRTATPRPTVTQTRVSVSTPTATRTRTATTLPSRTATATIRPTSTVAPTRTRTRTPTVTPGATPTIIFIGAEPLTVSARPEYLASTDFNHDGNTDLVVISPLSEEMNVLLGSSETASRFSPVTVYQFGERLRGAATGDFNADGNPDIVVVDPGEQGVWIALGRGDGTFLVPQLLAVGNSPFGVAVAQFDDTPGDDLAVADRQRNSILVGLSNGADPPQFSFGPEFFSGADPEALVAVDLNRDGHADIATLNVSADSTIGVLLWQRIDNDGAAVFAPVVSYDAGERPEALIVSDVNGDGNGDLLWLNRPAGNPNHDLGVYLSQGDGSLQGLPSRELGCPFATNGSCPARGLATGDFEEDGNIDLAVTMADPRGGSEGDIVRTLQGRGNGSFANGPYFPVGKDVLAISAGDYTGDGPIDLAVTATRDLEVQALINISVLASNGSFQKDSFEEGGRSSVQDIR